jgi:aerobic carbon-monoxide dehydrogenase large subunit
VRWVEGRSESLVAATHGRGQRHRLDVAADERGRVLALDAEVVVDVGAYPHTGALVAAATALMMSGPYAIPQLRVRLRGVVTSTTPTAPYRGAGRPEAAMSLERMMDELARRVGRDPADVRLTNFVPETSFPYDTPTGARYDSGRYALVLREAVALAGYHDVRAEQRRRRDGTDRALLGVGLASYVERSGGATGSTEFGSVEVGADGAVLAVTGSSSQGQGHRTSFAQIVANALGVDPGRVEVVQGDTDRVPEGTGTFASRSTQVGGSALHLATVELLDDARRAASRHLEVDGADLVYAAGTFSAAGAPERAVTLEGLVREGVALAATATFSSAQAFPYGTHVAVVEVDADTGAIEVRALIAVDDCGTIVNHRLVEGQALGSMVQGLAQALFESAPYDDSGQPLATSFLTYSMPSAADVPPMQTATVETPSPFVPIGAKGAGESGCIGTPAALVNAVFDALDGHDTSRLAMPLSPERVWSALHGR